MFKVYLAGPIRGLSYTSATDWRITAAEQLAPEIIAYSPLRAKDMLKGMDIIDTHGQIRHPLTVPKGVCTRDRFDVTTCDLLLVNLLEAKMVSIGTILEIAWADMLRKPIVIAMEETGNPHDHIMIREIAGFIVPTLDEAIHITKAILLPS